MELDIVPTVSHKRKRDQLEQTTTPKTESIPVPKRALTCWNLYLKRIRPKLMAKYPDASFAEMCQLASRRYKKMSEEKKQFYHQQQLIEKQRYQTELEEYLKVHPEGLPEKKRRRSSRKTVSDFYFPWEILEKILLHAPTCYKHGFRYFKRSCKNMSLVCLYSNELIKKNITPMYQQFLIKMPSIVWGNNVSVGLNNKIILFRGEEVVVSYSITNVRIKRFFNGVKSCRYEDSRFRGLFMVEKGYFSKLLDDDTLYIQG
eukprot:TRINITY_DN12308_c0_g1_i1.p1 TRINITY_DN12308_c0_g1~~TRINITY_DN12308_c0_g1_i1.p1  ORF type:complete len:259 (+),score=32.80 TRINITY_DN12308_c0_g1_i1:26-802(+)